MLHIAIFPFPSMGNLEKIVLEDRIRLDATLRIYLHLVNPLFVKCIGRHWNQTI